MKIVTQDVQGDLSGWSLAFVDIKLKITFNIHCWASRHSLGFEHEDLGSSPSYLLPKQAGGTPQILVFITLRMTGRPTVYNECFAMAIDLTWTATDRATALISFIH